jgi:phosphoglycolate phosphatase
MLYNKSKYTKLHQFEHYFFDFDGTLCNSSGSIFCAMQKAFEEVGMTPPNLKLLETTLTRGYALESWLKVLLEEQNISDSQITSMANAYRKVYQQYSRAHACLYPEVENVLSELKAQNKKIWIFSNKSEQVLIENTEQLGINSYFDGIFGCTSNIEEEMKPFPHMFQNRFRQSMPVINTNHILMVGDTCTDIRFAKNICVDVCWATYGYGDKSTCPSYSPNYAISNLLQILDLPQHYIHT